MNLDAIELVPATAETRNKLENLITLYLHDLSEFADDLKVNQDGKFEYEGIELYFTRDELKPFFIYFHDEVVGFILLNSGNFVPKDIDYSVHEFFILKSFRKKGIGSAAVRKLMDIYKGKYKIVQLAGNKPAINFWKSFYRKQGIEYSESIEVIDDLKGLIQVLYV